MNSLPMQQNWPREHIKRITKPLPESAHVEQLNLWVKFFEQSALVVLDDLNAFVMFETLNDRGLKTSQADLLSSSFVIGCK
jgi:hypothetical protein